MGEIEERRTAPRFVAAVDVEISGGGLFEPRIGHVVNMSSSGIFVEMSEPLPARFSQISLSFVFVEAGINFGCQGKVVRYGVCPNGRPGLGIELLLKPENEALLKTFMESLTQAETNSI